MAMNGRSDQARKLKDVMRKIRAQEAGRTTNAGAADNSADRLQALREDLRDLVDDIPREADFFNFSITDDRPPRLLIDETTFIVPAHGHGGFRMLKNSRAGRLLLKETSDNTEMANAVVHYVAERLTGFEAEIEPQPQPQPVQPSRADAGSRFQPRREAPPPRRLVQEPPRTDYAYPPEPELEPETVYVEVPVRQGTFWRSVFWFLMGGLSGAFGLLAYAWFRSDVDALVQKWLTAPGL